MWVICHFIYKLECLWILVSMRLTILIICEYWEITTYLIIFGFLNYCIFYVFSIILKYHFIYLKSRETTRGGERERRESFHPLIHSPNVRQRTELEMPIQNTETLSVSPPNDAVAHTFGLSMPSCTWAGSWIGSWASETWAGTLRWNPDITEGDLTCVPHRQPPSR